MPNNCSLFALYVDDKLDVEELDAEADDEDADDDAEETLFDAVAVLMRLISGKYRFRSLERAPGYSPTMNPLWAFLYTTLDSAGSGVNTGFLWKTGTLASSLGTNTGCFWDSCGTESRLLNHTVLVLTPWSL